MVIGYYDYDVMNKEGRTCKNTRQNEYNCAGYALNLFNWFAPYNNYGEGRRAKNAVLNNDYSLALNIYSNYLLEFFKDKIRIISALDELAKDEYAIAFRIGKDDFHFMKRAKNGHWSHKRGGCEVEQISKEALFSKIWYNYGVIYDSQLILFAMKEN